MACSPRERDTKENMRLCVQNTFLHVKDVLDDTKCLNRSQSDPSLYSGSETSASEHFVAHDYVGHVVFTDVGNQPPKINAKGLELEICGRKAAANGHGGFAVFSDGQPKSNDAESKALAILAIAKRGGHCVFADGTNDLVETGDAVLEKEASLTRDHEAMLLLHQKGQCRPCNYSSSGRGCRNGEACNFCHLAHRKSRPCKAKRSYCRRVASQLDASAAGDPDQYTGYMRIVMLSKARLQGALLDADTGMMNMAQTQGRR